MKKVAIELIIGLDARVKNSMSLVSKIVGVYKNNINKDIVLT